MGRSRNTEKNRDFRDRRISKDIRRKKKRSSKRRASEKLNGIRSLDDAINSDDEYEE